MKHSEIAQWEKYGYEEKCECGKVFKVLTQEDDVPEYHTNIYILCECGAYVQFDLPVN